MAIGVAPPTTVKKELMKGKIILFMKNCINKIKKISVLTMYNHTSIFMCLHDEDIGGRGGDRTHKTRCQVAV